MSAQSRESLEALAVQAAHYIDEATGGIEPVEDLILDLEQALGAESIDTAEPP